jgi:hypothetical protein
MLDYFKLVARGKHSSLFFQKHIMAVWKIAFNALNTFVFVIEKGENRLACPGKSFPA